MAAEDLLTLDEARSIVRHPAGDTAGDDDLLNIYVPAVTATVEDITGPVVRRTFTANIDGGSLSAILPHMGVSSVTSVLESGAALAVDEFTTDLAAGILYRGAADSPSTFTPGRGSVVATYVAGIADDTEGVPPAIKLGAGIILAHLWQTNRQGYRPDFGGPDDAVSETRSGFAVPRRAYTLLRPYSAHTVRIA